MYLDSIHVGASGRRWWQHAHFTLEPSKAPEMYSGRKKRIHRQRATLVQRAHVTLEPCTRHTRATKPHLEEHIYIVHTHTHTHTHTQYLYIIYMHTRACFSVCFGVGVGVGVCVWYDVCTPRSISLSLSLSLSLSHTHTHTHTHTHSAHTTAPQTPLQIIFCKSTHKIMSSAHTSITM